MTYNIMYGYEARTLLGLGVSWCWTRVMSVVMCRVRHQHI